jgi:hypothetical protein
MLRPNRSKKKPPIEISDNKSIFTFSVPSFSPNLFRIEERVEQPQSSLSTGLFRIGEKRGYPQSSSKKEKQKPVKKKPTTTIESIPSIPFSFSPLSLE